MRSVPRLPALAGLLLALLPVPAHAATGGASADAAPGGALDAAQSGAVAYGTPMRQRPVAKLFRVSPRTVREGARPLIRLRVDESGVDTVAARVVAVDARTRRVGARIDLGDVRTGAVVRVRWPKGRLPKRGRYLVRLHVTDPQGATLARAARTSGRTSLVVRPRPRRRPQRPRPAPPKRPAPTPEAPTPAPAPAGGVFPVAGAYTIAGAGGEFGAKRPGHSHEGHDIAAAEGTPVVSPVPGTIAKVANQPSAAGWYVVLNADDGRAMFFAHCQAGSVAVAEGRRVGAGDRLCGVGSTGSATGPHLHFEIWEGGWRTPDSRPIDPLAQLRAWAAR